MAAPPKLAILGVLFLSVGDAGASIGTAAGKWPVFSSQRMIEGSIACWTLCSAMGYYVGLPAQVRKIHIASRQFLLCAVRLLGSVLCDCLEAKRSMHL